MRVPDATSGHDSYYRPRATGLFASLAAINRDVQPSHTSAHSSETRPSARFNPSDVSRSGEISITPSQHTHLGGLSSVAVAGSMTVVSRFIHLPPLMPVCVSDPPTLRSASLGSNKPWVQQTLGPTNLGSNKPCAQPAGGHQVRGIPALKGRPFSRAG